MTPAHHILCTRALQTSSLKTSLGRATRLGGSLSFMSMAVRTAYFFILFCISLSASAQRTIPLQKSVSLSCLSLGRSLCAEVSLGSYTPGGIWEIGVDGNLGQVSLFPTDVKLQFLQTTLSASYLHRLLSTRSRSVSFYGGGGVLAGLESLDPFGLLPSQVELSMGRHNFLSGVFIEGQMELFLSRKTAILLGMKIPGYFTSKVQYLSPVGKIGLRVNMGPVK